MPKSFTRDHAPTSNGSLSVLANRWQLLKRENRQLAQREKELNKLISAAVDAAGTPDDKGHIWLNLDLPFDGWDGKDQVKHYNALQRQRRVSVIMDEEEAKSLARQVDIYDEVVHTFLPVTNATKALAVLREARLLDQRLDGIVQVDQDALVQAYFDEKITQDQYESVFSSKIVWALLPAKT